MSDEPMSNEAINDALVDLMNSDGAPQEELEEQPESELEGEEEEEEEQEESGSEEETSEEEVSEEESEESDLPTFTWTVNGEEVQITEEEAKNGYLRQSDYTQKTQEVSDQRKQHEADTAQLNEARTATVKLYETALVHAQAELAPFASVDWQALKDSDPYEAQEQASNYLAAQQKYNAVATAAQQVQHQQAEEAHKQLVAFVTNEKELLKAAIPEFLDETTAKAYQTKLSEYGTSIGFTKEEMSQAYDHRQLVLLDKAQKYDALMSETTTTHDKKVKPKIGKSLSSGTQTTKATRSNKAQAKRLDNVRKAGSRRSSTSTDAAAVDALYHLLN